MTGPTPNEQTPADERADRPHGDEPELGEQADRTAEQVSPAPGAPMQRGENR